MKAEKLMEKKWGRKRILRGFKTLFFLITLMPSLPLFSSPTLLLAMADALLPSALSSAFISPHSHPLTAYRFQSSTTDIPLISIARSALIICAYSVCCCALYVGVAVACSVASAAFVSLKAACILSSSGAGANARRAMAMRFQPQGLQREQWATAAMFLASLLLALGHIFAAYNVRCRERRKLMLYRIDIEALKLSWKVIERSLS